MGADNGDGMRKWNEQQKAANEKLKNAGRRTPDVRES
jgi:hypothetical protein